MFVCVLALIYISVLAFIYGSATVRLFHRLLGLEHEPDVPIALTNITGLIVLAILAGYLSFFLKIGLWANVLVATAAVIIYFLYRTEIHRNILLLIRNANRVRPSIWIIFILVCALVIIEGADVPKVGDSGLYHIQTIKWIESYRAVPGLGNLHSFFAWNSMWYPLLALFGFSFFGIQFLHVVNGAFYLFALAFFLGGVTEILNGEYRVTSLVKAAAIPFSLFVYKPQIGSPATDLPAALLVWIALLIILEKRNLPFQPDVQTAISLIISIYAVTVKLSVLPVLLLWIFIFYRQYRSVHFARIGLRAVLITAILIPWIGRNIILSGYLVYPIATVDLFNVDWKLPYLYVLQERLATQGWARLPGPEWRASLDMPLSKWVANWYGWLPYHYKRVVTTTALITFVHLGTIASHPGNSLRQIKRSDALMLVYLTACLGILYWFTSAPDPRFGFGFIFFALILPITTLMRWFITRYPAAARLIMLSILLVYILNHVFLSIRYLPKNANILVLPAPYPTMALETKIIDNFVFYFPITTDQCWYAPLPCMPVLNDGLQLRGTSLQEGFRIAN